MRIRARAGHHKTTCSKCGKELEDHRREKQRYCLVCHAAQMRINRVRHADLSPEAKKKANARSHANEYLRRGKIQRQKCLICSSDKAEKHHEDYSRPLDIIWLCRKHHLLLHENESFRAEVISLTKSIAA